ncbi:MAG: tetratricopeptide repeat protein [Alteromonadaceae bacterium]|nr:tetratricopeptide repeat protein [Alteromonadaceae bacterium]
MFENAVFSLITGIALRIGTKPLVTDSDFYLAFATLDQGLDQSTTGIHGKDEQKLQQAIVQLENFMATNPSAIMQANALVFLGWAYTDLGQLDLALTQLREAKMINQKLNMTTTLSYSNYSIMRIHLARGDYKLVTDMADETITTTLQARFLARAYYEQGQIQQAINVLQKAKQQRPALWQSDDSVRLSQYQSAITGNKLSLSPEPLAHLVYCESDWEH